MNKHDLGAMILVFVCMGLGVIIGLSIRDIQSPRVWNFKNEPPNEQHMESIKIKLFKDDIVYIDDTENWLSFVVDGGIFYERIDDKFLSPQENEVAAQGEIIIDFGEWLTDK